MKVLIDAQLPQKLAVWFAAAGCDALHTLDLPNANRSTDQQLIEQADLDGRVLVTKDADFVNSHLLSGRPGKLLLVSTGNISNAELGRLFVPLVSVLIAAFQTHAFIELTRGGIIIRG
jgi:predicted nuclease of predicted toxin-antitoxin system